MYDEFENNPTNSYQPAEPDQPTPADDLIQGYPGEQPVAEPLAQPINAQPAAYQWNPEAARQQMEAQVQQAEGVEPEQPPVETLEAPYTPYQEFYTGKEQPKRKGGLWRYASAGIAGMVVGALIFGSALSFAGVEWNTLPNGPLLQNGIENYLTSNPVTPVANGAMSVVDIAKKAGPAVVGVVNTKTTTTFFGQQMQQEGGGSGVILKPDGYIVTNAHVVEGASSVRVELSTGKGYDAKIVGYDEKTDLAVIKIEETNLPFVEIGKSAELQVGEQAVVIGNPGGQEFAGSVTAGVISALNRSMNVQNRQYNLIQTDAAINPGNSGGALLNRFGQLVGISSVKVGGEGYEGMGFAIPIDEAMPIINELMTGDGYIKGRPFIGVGTRDITEELARAYDLPQGVYITSVAEFSAAEKAGLRIADVIIKVDGKDVKTRAELDKAKEAHKAGDEMTLVVMRDGKQVDVRLILGEETPIKKQ